MDLQGARAVRDRLSRLARDAEARAAAAAGQEQGAAMGRRKNALLLGDVRELRRRQEEQRAQQGREESRLFAQARALAGAEDANSQKEEALAEAQAQKAQLEGARGRTGAGERESELVLGLYEGCAGRSWAQRSGEGRA